VSEFRDSEMYHVGLGLLEGSEPGTYGDGNNSMYNKP
jgi:hypothetical protein